MKIAMGNIERIWGAVLDQTLALQINQATNKGEFITVIDVLCCQMEEADNCLDHHQAGVVKHSSHIHQAQQSSNFVGD